MMKIYLSAVKNKKSDSCMLFYGNFSLKICMELFFLIKIREIAVDKKESL